MAEHLWFMGVGKEFDSDIREPLSCGDFYWPSDGEQPDRMDICSAPYPAAAYYYNRGVECGFPTGVCYKQDACAFGCGIVEAYRKKTGKYWRISGNGRK